MNRINTFIEMTKQDYNIMTTNLEEIKKYIDDEITSIDVRLCVDIDLEGEMTWIIRSGDSSYDQRHEPICGASSVESDTDVIAVLEELIDQCADQCAEIDSIQGLDKE